jgi:hypothetical protein
MEITAEIIAEFRTNYPQFSNTTTYPDSVVTKALCEGDVKTGSSRWGAYQDICQNFKQRGMFLYAAHWISVYYPKGGDEPPATNPTWAWNSKTVRNQSISYDTGVKDLSPTNAWLLSTIFGQQFYGEMKKAALGGVSV